MFSVVIPAYGSTPYLEDCLRGLASQSVAPTEIIVFHTGPHDPTARILPLFPGVRVVHEDARQYAGGARPGARAIVVRRWQGTNGWRSWIAIWLPTDTGSRVSPLRQRDIRRMCLSDRSVDGLSEGYGIKVQKITAVALIFFGFTFTFFMGVGVGSSVGGFVGLAIAIVGLFLLIIASVRAWWHHG